MMRGGDFTNATVLVDMLERGMAIVTAERDSQSECAQSAWTIPDEADNGRIHTPGALQWQKLVLQTQVDHSS